MRRRALYAAAEVIGAPRFVVEGSQTIHSHFAQII
jgi:hypothetical protein